MFPELPTAQELKRAQQVAVRTRFAEAFKDLARAAVDECSVVLGFTRDEIRQVLEAYETPTQTDPGVRFVSAVAAVRDARHEQRAPAVVLVIESAVFRAHILDVRQNTYESREFEGWQDALDFVQRTLGYTHKESWALLNRALAATSSGHNCLRCEAATTVKVGPEEWCIFCGWTQGDPF